MRLEDDVHEAPAGTFVFVPKDVPDTWQNSGDAIGRLLAIFAPASVGMEAFFQGFAAIPLIAGRRRVCGTGARGGDAPARPAACDVAPALERSYGLMPLIQSSPAPWLANCGKLCASRRPRSRDVDGYGTPGSPGSRDAGAIGFAVQWIRAYSDIVCCRTRS